MTVAFEVERFERVDASAGTVLLRLAGTFRADAPTELRLPELVVDDGRRARRIMPLPDPSAGAPAADPDGRAWRAAFPVPADVLESGRIAYALDASDAVIDLPRPARTRAAPPRRGPARRRAAIDLDWLQRQIKEAAGLRDLAEREHQRAEALRGELAGLAREREETEALREEVVRLRQERRAAIEELEARLAREAEQRHLAEERLAEEHGLRLAADRGAVESRAAAEAAARDPTAAAGARGVAERPPGADPPPPRGGRG